jgi:hypothetical protein
MTSITAPPTTIERTAGHNDDRRLFRWAGGLGLAHVLVMLAAFSGEGVSSVEHGAAPMAVLHAYRAVSTTRVELYSYLEAMSFTLLLPALVLLAGLLGRRTEAGRVAARTALALGVAYAGSTFAIGFPPLTAAVYAAHHGVDPATVTTVNDLRDYGFVLQVALSMAFVLALGVAALSERVLTKWVGWGGVAVGGIGIVATPFVHNAVSMLWLVWWVGLAVLCLRGGPRGARA